MNHLREDQFIDVLMGEPRSASVDMHLAECTACQNNMQGLQDGLRAARIAEPRVPTMPLLPIRFAKFKRQSMMTRLAWLGAAAMLFLSLLGFRVEFSDQGFSMAFSLWQQPATTQNEERIRELETTLAIALDEMHNMTQQQINMGLAAFYAERDQEIGSFQAVMANKFQELSFDQAENAVTLKQEFEDLLRKDDVRGKLQ